MAPASHSIIIRSCQQCTCKKNCLSAGDTNSWPLFIPQASEQNADCNLTFFMHKIFNVQATREFLQGQIITDLCKMTDLSRFIYFFLQTVRAAGAGRERLRSLSEGGLTVVSYVPGGRNMIQIWGATSSAPFGFIDLYTEGPCPL